VDGVWASLGWPHIVSKGLNILGQGKVGQGMVVTRCGGGRGYRLQVGPVACPGGWWKDAWHGCLPESGGSGAGGGKVVRSQTNPSCQSSVKLSVVGQ